MFKFLPYCSGGHRFWHLIVESVTAFASENIVDANGAVALTSSDVFVVVVEAHAEGGCRAITQLVLFGDFYVAVLSGDDGLLVRAGRKILFLLLVGHHG
jgi:hypothetical protein